MQAEHNDNHSRFLEVTKKFNLVLNQDNVPINYIQILGSSLHDGEIHLDPDRLVKLPLPEITASLHGNASPLLKVDSLVFR